jgi:hypothetical protein
MMLQPEVNPRGGSVWLLLAGFAVAALLTLGAAIGTSAWQQDSGAREVSANAPVAQK